MTGANRIATIPIAAMTGEAAGVAAALCARSGITPEKLDYALLKSTLDAARAGKTGEPPWKNADFQK